MAYPIPVEDERVSEHKVTNVYPENGELVVMYDQDMCFKLPGSTSFTPKIGWIVKIYGNGITPRCIYCGGRKIRRIPPGEQRRISQARATRIAGMFRGH